MTTHQPAAPAFTPEQARIHQLLDGRRIDEIRIAILPGGFVWKLFSGTEEIFAGQAGADQVAGMLLSTEVLMNTELGIPGRTLGRADAA